MLKIILSLLTGLIYVLGVSSFGFGIYFAIYNPELAEQYFHKSSGQMIDKGTHYVVTAMVIHLLLQIKDSIDAILKKMNNS